MRSENVLEKLQDWYACLCNDDWEHTYGITIGNIDNPGWSLKVELIHTYLENVPFEPLKIQREKEDDWINCRIEDSIFYGYGGPFNLKELLEVFLSWAEKHNS